MPPAPATDRLARLLVMIPWIMRRGRVQLDDVATAFGITRAQAEADVLLASMIGIPPFSPDCLVELTLDEDHVDAVAGEYLVRAPQLSAAQGFALLAAGRALVDVAESPLASALAKLERVLGDPSVVSVDLQRPEFLDVVRDAVENGTRLQITYYAAWRDELTERAVDPHVVFQRNGRWYVRAYCHRVDDMRSFRVDRIRALEPTGETFEPVRAEPPDAVFDAGPDATRVVIDIPASERWVIEAYHPEVEERGDTLRVTMHVLGTAWLERLLLKVGPAARVVEPEPLRTLAADAATRLLAAYGG